MEFEYDPAKSAKNAEKHGIDFDAAQELWRDPDAYEAAAAYRDEPRFAVIGKIGEKHWTAIVTYREDRTRIISVRRSRDKEVKLYEDDSR